MVLQSTKPRFRDIARILTEGIQSGRFPLGSFLPTELELVHQYGTSRHTVRAALRELEQLGLVSRRKNTGTRVESGLPTRSFRPSLASVEDLVQFGQTHVRAVQSIEETTVDASLAKELGCAPGTRWLRISSLRLQGDAKTAPIGWTNVYIDPAYSEIADAVRASPTTLVSSLIESRYGRRIAEIQQDTGAVAASATLAHALGVEVGKPMLKVVRRYLDTSGQLVEVSVSFHPPERFSVSMRLRRSEA